MKKEYKVLAALGLAGSLFSAPATAADVPYTSVLSGNVVSVTPVGTAVKEGDVLVTVDSLAGPMAAARANGDGTVKSVYVAAGASVESGAVVVVLEEK